MKNAFIELCIEQWIHSLYLQPGPDFQVATSTYEIVKYMKHLQFLQIAPTTVFSETIEHNIQTLPYFALFTASILKLCQQEFAALQKATKDQKPAIKDAKEQPESASLFEISLLYQSEEEERIDFECLEDLRKFIESSFITKKPQPEKPEEEDPVLISSDQALPDIKEASDSSPR